MKFVRSFIVTTSLSALCIAAQTASASASASQAEMTSPYMLLGCTLDTSAEFPQYITTSVTYGYNPGKLHAFNYTTCAQNLEYSQSHYNIIHVTSVGNEIVYTLKYKTTP